MSITFNKYEINNRENPTIAILFNYYLRHQPIRKHKYASKHTHTRPRTQCSKIFYHIKSIVLCIYYEPMKNRNSYKYNKQTESAHAVNVPHTIVCAAHQDTSMTHTHTHTQCGTVLWNPVM